jgi:hypothetical protein
MCTVNLVSLLSSSELLVPRNRILQGCKQIEGSLRQFVSLLNKAATTLPVQLTSTTYAGRSDLGHNLEADSSLIAATAKECPT